MRAVTFILLHCAGLIGCSFFLWWLDKGDKRRKFFWPASCILSILLVAVIFMVSHSDPVFEDFVPVYWSAGSAVLSGPAGLMPLIGKGVDGGFVNLPVLAYLFTPFALLPPYLAGWIYTALGVTSLIAAWWLAAAHFRFNEVERGVSLLMFAGFGPLIYSLREGNLTHFLLLVLVLAVINLRQNREFGAGLLLGLSALIKPPLILLCLYALVRFRWQMVLGVSSVLLASAILSIWIFGWDMHVLWFSANLGTFSQDVVAARNSHSIASVLARFHYGVDALDNWSPLPVPAALRYAGLSLAALLALLALWAAAPWRNWLVGKDEFEADLMLIIVLVLCVSTLSWTHYFSWLLLPIMWLWTFLRQMGRPSVPTMLLAALVLLCSPAYLRWAAPAGLDAFLPLIFSYLLVGSIGLFGLLVWCRRQIATRGWTAPVPAATGTRGVNT